MIPLVNSTTAKSFSVKEQVKEVTALVNETISLIEDATTLGKEMIPLGYFFADKCFPLTDQVKEMISLGTVLPE